MTGDLLSQILSRSPLEPIVLLMITYSEQKVLPPSSFMVIVLSLLSVASLKVTMQQVTSERLQLHAADFSEQYATARFWQASQCCRQQW